MTTPLSQGLDTTSLFDEGSWSGTLFPGAGEMTGRMVVRSTPRSVVPSGDRCSEREGAARAARSARRFVVANELSAMATATFARSVSDDFAAKEMTLLMRRCKDARDPFPFLWTLERGSKRGRVHGHLLLPASLASLVEGQWPHGHIQVDVGADDWESLRQRAGYLSKAFDTPVLGGQRYRRAKGFQPEAVRIDAPSLDGLVAEAEAQMSASAILTHRGSLGVAAQWEA
jgi:hypothetical protein